MLKNGLIICFTVILLFMTATLSYADTATTTDFPNPLHYQVGWQITNSASGFSLKIPVKNQFYIQPIFAFSINENQGTTGTNGHFDLGIRGIRRLPERGNFLPYVGVGLGHCENYTGPTLGSATINSGNTGFEAFLGVEYQKYVIRPSLEIGLGSYSNADGSYYAGTTLNLGLMYSF